MARTAPARSKRVTVGEQFPTLLLRGLNDEPVQIPDPTGALTHLQFRRFAGCPVCNLHLRSISGRIEEINTAGIREVVVFHSTAAELRKYQDDMPFAVVGDPDKDLYRRFGVEASTKPSDSRPGARCPADTGTPSRPRSPNAAHHCPPHRPTATSDCPPICSSGPMDESSPPSTAATPTTNGRWTKYSPPHANSDRHQQRPPGAQDFTHNPKETR